MKNAVLYFLLLTHFSLFAQPLIKRDKTENHYQLSNILIEGETNINGFAFSFNNSKITINPTTEKLDKASQSNDIIEFFIPVRAFRGSNYLMEGDFRDLLKANEYPMVKVGIEKKNLNSIVSETNNSKIYFYLTIAGVTKLISGEYLINLCNKDEIILQGTSNVKLTDFCIVPPKKMLGVLQVKDVIFIKFDIIISTLNS
jgi:hypothetical protein